MLLLRKREVELGCKINIDQLLDSIKADLGWARIGLSLKLHIARRELLGAPNNFPKCKKYPYGIFSYK